MKRIRSQRTARLSVVSAVLLLSACKASGTNTAAVNIVVSGLTGTVELQTSGGPLTLSSDGTHSFAIDLRKSSAYAVTIQTQPSGQSCSLTNGSGHYLEDTVPVVELNCGGGNGTAREFPLGVYFLGTVTDTDGTVVPGYWDVSSTWTALPIIDRTKAPLTYTASRIGSDLYFTGENSGPGYWKNAVWTSLEAPSATPICTLSSVVESGSDLYVVGSCGPDTERNAQWIQSPGYWKNGQWTALATPDASVTYTINGALAFQGSLYIVGYYRGNGSTTGGFWKDGTWNEVPKSGTNGASTSGIFILDNDFYVSGTRIQPSNTGTSAVPGYWKNGTTFTGFTYPTLSASAESPYVLESDIYISGKLEDPQGGETILTPAYWKNGVFTDLPSPYGSSTKPCYSRGIVLFEGDFYASAHCQTAEGQFIAGFWKNDGTMTELPGLDETKRSMVTSISN